MSEYRIYSLSSDGCVTRWSDVQCDSDQTALLLAINSLKPGAQTEVWSGKSLVGIAMTENTPNHGAPADGGKLLVRILARRRRPTSEPDLRVIFEREGAPAAGFAAAMQHALLHQWITRRPDGLLTGPRRKGLEAAGLR